MLLDKFSIGRHSGPFLSPGLIFPSFHPFPILSSPALSASSSHLCYATCLSSALSSLLFSPILPFLSSSPFLSFIFPTSPVHLFCLYVLFSPPVSLPCFSLFSFPFYLSLNHVPLPFFPYHVPPWFLSPPSTSLLPILFSCSFLPSPTFSCFPGSTPWPHANNHCFTDLHPHLHPSIFVTVLV